MDVAVTTEQHFYRTPDGVFVVGDEDHQFFTRYRAVFDSVHVLARVRRAALPPPNARPVEGSGVRVVDLPEFRGTRGYVRNVLPVLFRLNRLVGDGERSYVLRPPGGVASLTWLTLQRAARPFGVEVVSDPARSFTVEAFGSADAKLIRPVAVRLLRAQTAGAVSTAYVTQRTLQASYPPRARDFTFSSIDIGEEAFDLARVTLERIQRQPERLAPGRLVFVGRLQRPLKGLDTLLQAMAELRPTHELMLDVVGGGGLIDGYRGDAEALGLGSRVRFHGELTSRAALLEQLAAADVFVLPSRREGLPRAVIEAMAVGLPCVASNVGGIPELLPANELIATGDAAGLARRIAAFFDSKAARVEASRRNAAVARAYGREHLAEQRRLFYTDVLTQTKERLAARAS
jgi:phosphatidyl-myo-inositol dimannoside synthase